ncbi:hypothetical protein [Halanaerobium kushneri]|uniref:Uncharacterized protein n=1 Tax=Halanaerobium kushneri TaxID=56779 RepID=A0A1N7B4Q6_9FIRM|nr:hypothetical protein [Halanaerobium kushneri]SIR46329.1 hypothetical protein SAMN05421834_12814 [Halanaerobium kushneri]
MFNKKELIRNYKGEKITKNREWVKKYNPLLIDHFQTKFEEMTYYLADDGLRYYPKNDVMDIIVYRKVKLRHLRFLPEIEREIEKLKCEWAEDPAWDIEDTEGFEPFKDELLNYKRFMTRYWENKQKQIEEEKDQKANQLGLEGLYRMILNLQERNRILGNWIKEIQDKCEDDNKNEEKV